MKPVSEQEWCVNEYSVVSVSEGGYRVAEVHSPEARRAIAALPKALAFLHLAAEGPTSAAEALEWQSKASHILREAGEIP